MPNPLINVACQDAYSDAASIMEVWHGNGGTFVVSVQAVRYQVQYGFQDQGDEAWTDEAILQPGAGSIDKGAIGIRFRNAVAGSNATVSAYINPPGRPGVQITASQAASGATNLVPLPLASFPPSSPSDGDLVVIELPSTYDPVGGKKLRWLVQYNASDAVWDFLGGPPLYAEVLTAEGISLSGGYSDLATVGPSITIPRSGDYIIGVNAPMSGDSGPNSGAMSYQIGGTAASDNDSAEGVTAGGATGAIPFIGAGSTRFREKTGLAATNIVTAKYKNNGSSHTCFFGLRWLLISPVRIT